MGHCQPHAMAQIQGRHCAEQCFSLVDEAEYPLLDGLAHIEEGGVIVGAVRSDSRTDDDELHPLFSTGLSNGILCHDLRFGIRVPKMCSGHQFIPINMTNRLMDRQAAHENEALLDVYRDYFQGDEAKIEQMLNCEYEDTGKRGGYREKSG